LRIGPAFARFAAPDVLPEISMRVFATFLLTTILQAFPALAGPEGSYSVVGVNPDTGGNYTGRVEVSRVGDTYRVTWNIGGTRYIGTGLGARVVDGRYIVGVASPDDTALAVGYVSAGSFGQAFYFVGADGQWTGVWTYGGSNVVSTEKWTRR
jgi:hypothetical protein